MLTGVDEREERFALVLIVGDVLAWGFVVTTVLQQDL